MYASSACLVHVHGGKDSEPLPKKLGLGLPSSPALSLMHSTLQTQRALRQEPRMAIPIIISFLYFVLFFSPPSRIDETIVKERLSANSSFSFLPFHQSYSYGCMDAIMRGKMDRIHGGKPRKRDYPFGRWFPFLFAQSRYRIFGFSLTNSDAFALNFIGVRGARASTSRWSLSPASRHFATACLAGLVVRFFLLAGSGARIAWVRPRGGRPRPPASPLSVCQFLK